MKTIVRGLLLYLVLQSSAYAIVDGTDAGINEYQSIGAVVGVGLGSFVALSSSWVLTAAHVVDVFDPIHPDYVMGALPLLLAGHPDSPPTPEEPFGGEPLFVASRVILHPDYVIGEFSDDLALIEIGDIFPFGLIDPSTQDISFATLSNVPLMGSIPATTTITGYGLDDFAIAAEEELPIETVFDRSFVSVATDTSDHPGVGGYMPPFPTDCGGGMILCAFGTAGGAPGDSGGGMFLDHTADGIDNPVVAAINSFVFDDFDLVSDSGDAPTTEDGYWTVGTPVAPYEAWIKNPEEGVFTGAQFAAASVPIPTAIWLFISGIVGLTAVTRRKTPA